MPIKQILPTVGSFLVNVIISVIGAAIVQQLLKLDLYQGVLLGTCLYISIEVIRLGYLFNRNLELLSKLTLRDTTWAETLKLVQSLSVAKNNIIVIDDKIRNISDGLRLIAERYSEADNLFLQWYHDKLDDIAKHISHTIETESYEFDNSHLQEQKRIYSLFQGRASDYFWATSTCDGINWYATTTGDLFHQNLNAKFQEGKLKGIRRIFIFQDEAELNEFQTRLCFLLHKQSGFEYKVIGKDDFEAVIKNFGDRTMVKDFGVYGAHFVWETDPDEDTPIRLGEFCVNKHRMAKYKQLYELIWDQSVLQEIDDEELLKKYVGYGMDSFRKLLLSSKKSSQ